MIDHGPQLGCRAGDPELLKLRGGRRHMGLSRDCNLARCWPDPNTARSAVVADRIDGDRAHHSISVDVGYVDIGYIVDVTIVKEIPSAPVSAFVAVTAVAVAIVDPAIVADLCAPISWAEFIRTVVPFPIRRRPKITYAGRENPGPGHPIIVINFVVPSPIARGPDEAITRDSGLLIDRKWRWWEADADSDTDLGLA